jgi:hypothetical protein
MTNTPATPEPTMTATKEISLYEWNTATTEQRAEWLNNKVTIRQTEVEQLRGKVLSYRKRNRK